jgi:hypothetical protein
VYLIAPPLGAVAAAAVTGRRAARACAKLLHPAEVPCRFCGQGMPPARRRAA